MKKLDNPKQIVTDGYNSITRNYLKLVESGEPAIREKYLRFLIDSLPTGARILELGCGAGVPMTKRLVSHFKVIGVDISKEQLILASRNVPEVSFILGDMTQLSFTEATFDAVAAFYSITHVPRSEHSHLLGNIYRMLKPGGLLVATMGHGDLPDTIEPDWLGAPMFFSHFDGKTNVKLISEIGFEIVSATDEWEIECGRPVCFRWIVAQKPGRA